MPESVMMSELALIAEANPPATDNKDFPSMLNESTSHIVSLSSSTHSVSDPPKPTRDSSWLQVDLCRNFLSDTCPRGQSCRYAHLESRAVVVKDGKVTCCYDFLKGRCQRVLCKYYHPPGHIKEKLVCAGKHFGAMMSTNSVLSASFIPPAMPPTFHSMGISGCGPDSSLATTTLCFPDRLHVCSDYVTCSCHVAMCPYAHPGPSVRCNADQTVTVCHNYIRWGCSREDSCRFYHPLPHQVLAPVPIQGFHLPAPVVPALPFLPVHHPLSICFQPLPYSAIPTSPMAMPNASFMLPPQPVGSMVPLTPHLVSPPLPGPCVLSPQQQFAVPVSVIESTGPTTDNSEQASRKPL